MKGAGIIDKVWKEMYSGKPRSKPEPVGAAAS
jgi:hypothetical protein